MDTYKTFFNLFFLFGFTFNVMFYLEIFLIFCSSFYVTITFADFNRFFFRVQRVITITLLLALVFDFQTARSEERFCETVKIGTPNCFKIENRPSDFRPFANCIDETFALELSGRNVPPLRSSCVMSIKIKLRF